MSNYGEQSLSNSHGDRSPWEYHNRINKTFIWEGWLNDVGLVDGHIPASTDKEAVEILNRMGTFKWMSMRFICTKYNPWNKDISYSVLHQGEWTRESCDGDVDHYKCRNCGQEYSVGH
jgi:hypothetical protein